jgi:hypothetical protein
MNDTNDKADNLGEFRENAKGNKIHMRTFGSFEIWANQSPNSIGISSSHWITRDVLIDVRTILDDICCKTIPGFKEKADGIRPFQSSVTFLAISLKDPSAHRFQRSENGFWRYLAGFAV